MTLELTKIFFDECSKAFGFLVTEHGFKPPTLEVNRLIHFATVTFMGTNLALECIFDEREAWVEFKVARVVNGEKAQDYAVDQTGNRGGKGVSSGKWGQSRNRCGSNLSLPARRILNR